MPSSMLETCTGGSGVWGRAVWLAVTRAQLFGPEAASKTFHSAGFRYHASEALSQLLGRHPFQYHRLVDERGSPRPSRRPRRSSTSAAGRWRYEPFVEV